MASTQPERLRKPKAIMLKSLGRYTWERLAGDCAGGFIAALIALPYGLSMAALMGLPPILGVCTSILTTPITAMLGRNPLLIGGTASATVPFVAAAVRAQGIGGAAKISIVASVFMMAFCIMKLGRFVSKVPTNVVAGFSAGIGALMVISQLHVLLGIHGTAEATPIVQLFLVLRELAATHWQPLVLGGAVILAAFATIRISPRLPAPLIGVTVSWMLAYLLRTHQPEVGSLHLSLPPFAGFSWTPNDVIKLIPSGFMLAFVSTVNLLLTSRTVEYFQGSRRPMRRNDQDTEVGAFGIANLFAGIFGAPMSVGIPARSVAAIRCGATSRMSNILHAVFLLLLVRLGSGALAHIPMAALAGVTIFMGLSLLDVSTWRRLHKMRPVDAIAFLVTVFGILTVNAVAAVLAGCFIYAGRFAYDKYLRSPAESPALTDIAA
jgi:MFS superfamily sulfate permease-like transporter